MIIIKKNMGFHLTHKKYYFRLIKFKITSLLFILWKTLTLIYPAHFEDVPCQSGVNHIFEG